MGGLQVLSLVKGEPSCILLLFAFQNECIESPGGTVHDGSENFLPSSVFFSKGRVL